MSANKTLNQWGVVVKDEVAYGDGTATALTDGVLVVEMPETDLDYVHDGSRGRNPAGGGQLISVGQAGRGGTFQLQTQMMLPSAFTGDPITSLDELIRWCGFEDTTVLDTSREYTPLPEGLESGSVVVYKQGQEYDFAGVYGTFGFAFDGPEVPLWTFDMVGIGSLPTDLAMPTVVYTTHLGSTVPGKALNLSLTLGAVTTLKLRSAEFALNRETSPRADDNSAGGHAGYTLGNRDPRLTVVVEAEALTTLDPYTLAEGSTTQDTHFTIAQGSRAWKFQLPQGEVVSVEDGEDGATALWEIEIAGRVSAPGLQDDISILCN